MKKKLYKPSTKGKFAVELFWVARHRETLWRQLRSISNDIKSGGSLGQWSGMSGEWRLIEPKGKANETD